MNSQGIYTQANALVRQNKTNNPLIIAEEIGIIVRDVPELTDLLGMYSCKWRKRMILMDPDINDTLYRMVLGNR